MNIKIYAILAAMTLMSLSMQAASNFDTSTVPSDVVKIYPTPDSRVDIGPNASPMGLQQISVLFNREVRVNTDCKEEACIFRQGEDTPLQTVGISGVSVDLTQPKMGSILFPNSCRENGSYRVTIPMGFWTIEGGSPSISGAFDLYYEILNPQQISPAESVVKQLSEFRLEFPGYQEAKLINADKIELFRHSSPDGYPLTIKEGKNDDGTPANYIEIKLAEPITEQGEYSLFVRAGAAEGVNYIGSDDTGITVEPNVEALYRYTVSQLDIPTITPKEGVIETFNSFELTVPEGAEFWFVNDRAVSFIYKVNDDGSLAPDASYRLTGRRIADTNKILLSINEKGETISSVSPSAGKYALQLASGLFSGSWNGEFINSAPFVYYYESINTEGSVESPTAPSHNASTHKGIYTIDGKMISEDAQTPMMKKLPEGIYVIEGKKTYLKSRN